MTVSLYWCVCEQEEKTFKRIFGIGKCYSLRLTTHSEWRENHELFLLGACSRTEPEVIDAEHKDVRPGTREQQSRFTSGY